METFIALIAQLRHPEASDTAKAAFKKNGDVKKALMLLAALEQAYFDGKLLRAKGKGRASQLDIQTRYESVIKQLQLLKASVQLLDDKGRDSLAISAFEKYCSLRCELVGFYRELCESGFNFIDFIPRLRTLRNLSTDLRPHETPRGTHYAGQTSLHLLAQSELDFLESVHQCLWELNRLQAPASVLHLAAAKKKLKVLLSSSDNLRKKVPYRLIQFLASLYASVYGKVTLVFLHVLQKPMGDAEEDPVSASGLSQADFGKVKKTIDEAGLQPLWPVCKMRKAGFGILGVGGHEGEHTAVPSVLLSVDMMQDEAVARLGCKPTFHIFYNAAAHGFSHSLNLSSNRLALPKYLPCGQRELPGSEALSGLKGFPCIATYPFGVASNEVAALLASIPLADAGKQNLLPNNVIVETVDYAAADKQRQHWLQMTEARKQAWSSKVKKARDQPMESSVGEPGNEKDLMVGEVNPKSWMEGIDECEDMESHARPAPGTPPPSPSNSSVFPSQGVRCCTTVATRIDLLFYAVLVFEGTPVDVSWAADWLSKFAACMITANTSHLTALSKEIKA